MCICNMYKVYEISTEICYISALGHHCPRRDHEAFMYAYGGLKFLTLNGKITAYLSDSLGFLHLCMLHTKVTWIVRYGVCVIKKWVVFQIWFKCVIVDVCHCQHNYRKVTSSGPVYHSILETFGHRSQGISIKFPLLKHSENAWVCY